MTTLVWFRDDLRLCDNPALTWAATRGEVVACVLDEPAYPGTRPLGSAAAWWRERSLAQLRQHLAEHGVPLLHLTGDATKTIPQLAHQIGADAVCWNRRYHVRDVDAAVKESLTASGIAAHSLPATSLLSPQPSSPIRSTHPSPAPPASIFRTLPSANHSLYRHCPVPEQRPSRSSRTPPLPALHCPGSSASPTIGSLVRPPPGKLWPDWSLTTMTATETSSPARLPPGSPRTCASAKFRSAKSGTPPASCQAMPRASTPSSCGVILPGTASTTCPPLPPSLSASSSAPFDWYRDTEGVRTDGTDPRPHAYAPLEAWRRGQTGIALVDAAMTELWHTGYMHNRARMVVGSFLTKNLGIDWRHGEEWFWDTLVDADPASNPFNWQWVAGCGDDAAPYFRIFNPELQSKKFDPDGAYVKRWAPPLSPPPIVDLKESRRAALDAYAEMKDATS